MRLSAALVILLAGAACKGSGDDTVNHLPDGAHGSGSGSDAGGSGSGTDAQPGATSCSAAIPTSAPATVNISGTLSDDDTSYGTEGNGLQGATVDAYHYGSATSLGSGASGPSTGLYMFDAATVDTPIDHLGVTLANYETMHYFPKAPLAHATTFYELPLLQTATFAALPGQYSVTQDPTKAVVVVQVVTCQTQRVTGATVSLVPSNGEVVKYAGGGAATDATGVAFIFNVDPLDYMVRAQAPGLDMQPVMVGARIQWITVATVSEK